MAGTFPGEASPVTVNGVTYSWATGNHPATGIYGHFPMGAGVRSPYSQASSLSSLHLGAANAGNYFAAEPTGAADPIRAFFPSPVYSYTLLWGSVDKYDEITVDLINGAAAVGSLNVTGNIIGADAGFTSHMYGLDSAVVTITSTLPFNELVFEDVSTSPAFEFVPIPEPASMAVLCSALVGMVIARYRKAGQQTRPIRGRLRGGVGSWG
jgi:hypothetical protein